MNMKQKARRRPQDWLCGMCMFGVSFLPACVCDLCRVRLWCCPSLLSSQAHKVTLAFAVSPHSHTLDTHTVTPAYAFLLTHTLDIYRHTPLPPLSLLVAPISGFRISIILLVWTGFIRSVCACAAVWLSVHMHCILMITLECGRHLSWSCDF